MKKIKTSKILKYMFIQDAYVSMTSIITLGLAITCGILTIVETIKCTITTETLKQYIIIGMFSFLLFYIIYSFTKQKLLCILEEKRLEKQRQQKEMLKQTELKKQTKKSSSKSKKTA